MESITVCVPFFALPGFPKECKFIDSNKFIIRDILQINSHKKGLYENGPYIEGFSIDNKLDYIFYFHEMQQIAEKKEYSKIDILFRAIYKDFEGNISHLIIGHYTTENPFIKETAPGIYSINAKYGHFVKAKDAVDITKTIIDYNLQNAILKDNSLNHPEYKEWISNWISKIKMKENIIDEYREKSRNLRTISVSNDYEKKCEGCIYKQDKNCPVWKKYLV